MGKAITHGDQCNRSKTNPFSSIAVIQVYPNTLRMPNYFPHLWNKLKISLKKLNHLFVRFWKEMVQSLNAETEPYQGHVDLIGNTIYQYHRYLKLSFFTSDEVSYATYFSFSHHIVKLIFWNTSTVRELWQRRVLRVCQS